MAPITSQTVEFNGTATQLLQVSAAADADAIAQTLVLPDFGEGILFFGGADQLDATLAAPVAAMLGNALLPTALKAQAVIIDGGARAGVMELMGQAMIERDHDLPLIGVAPEALVRYPGKTGNGLVELDPGHSHFVLVRGTSEWGSETSTLFKVFNGLENKSAPVPWASLVLLVGGGAITQTEILEAVRQRQPVIVFSGCGGFADVLTAAKAAATPATDPVVQTILARGELYFCPLTDPPETIQLTIGHFLEKDQVLQSAWEAFADFDCNAGLQQKTHKRYQSWIIRLGVLAAALGIDSQVFIKGDKDQFLYWLDKPLRGLLVVLPIVLTMLIAASNKFKNGQKWIFFRAGTEAIKREIYTFRARTGAYRGGDIKLLFK